MPEIHAFNLEDRDARERGGVPEHRGETAAGCHAGKGSALSVGALLANGEAASLRHRCRGDCGERRRAEPDREPLFSPHRHPPAYGAVRAAFFTVWPIVVHNSGNVNVNLPALLADAEFSPRFPPERVGGATR